MPKYQWESKPPITRSDVFSTPDAWEIGSFHASSDESAISRIQGVFERNSVVGSLTIRLLSGDRPIRTFKT